MVVVELTESTSKEGWSAAEERVRHELASVGLSVRRTQGMATSSADERDELESVTRAAKALGATRVRRVPSGARVDLWLPEPSSMLRVHRTLEIEGPPTKYAATVLAIRVAELFKSSLVEIRARASTDPSPPEDALPPPVAPKKVEAPPPKPPERFALGGVGGVGLPGERPVGLGPMLGFGWGFSRWFELGVEAFGALIGGTIRRNDANASIHLGFARAQLGFSPWRRAKLYPVFGIGPGVLVARVSGDSMVGLAGRVDSASTALATASAALVYRFNSYVQLRARIGIAASIPELTVHFATESVTKAGRPLVDGSVVLGLGF